MKKFKADEILLIVKFHRLFSVEMGFVPAPSFLLKKDDVNGRKSNFAR